MRWLACVWEVVERDMVSVFVLVMKVAEMMFWRVGSVVVYLVGLEKPKNLGLCPLGVKRTD